MSGPGHLRIIARAAVAGLLVAMGGCALAEAPEPQAVILGPAVIPAPPDKMAGAPKVGTCHQLNDVQINRGIDAQPAVPCSSPHTTVTYLVDTVPEEGSTRSKVAHVRRTCATGVAAAAGVPPGEIDGLMLTWASFEPDGAAQLRGATWFRCDVLALPQAKAARKSLPGKGLPLIEGAVPDALRRCAVATAEQATTFISCDQEHTHRWTGSVAVKGNSYPDAGAWRAEADAGCRPLVGTDAFVFTYPSATDWGDGVRRLSCFRQE